MTDALILEAFNMKIDGGCAMFDLFLWLEEHPEVSEDEACRVFDDNYFVCENCSWTLPISCLAYDTGRNFVCEDCVSDEDAEDWD